MGKLEPSPITQLLAMAQDDAVDVGLTAVPPTRLAVVQGLTFQILIHRVACQLHRYS